MLTRNLIRSMESHRLDLVARQVLAAIVTLDLVATCGWCQIQAGVYDFGQNRWGEKRGSWTPGEWLAVVLLIMSILLGLALSVGLCYYVNRNQAQKSAMKANTLKRRHLQMSQQALDGSQVIDSPSVYQSHNYERQFPRQQYQQLQYQQRVPTNESLEVEI